jgi:hypothetical protein
MMRLGGRILAVTYAPSARTGSWQPWIAMGAGKAAVEALLRYFAVALARRRDHRERHQPGFDRRQRPQWSTAGGAGHRALMDTVLPLQIQGAPSDG